MHIDPIDEDPRPRADGPLMNCDLAWRAFGRSVGAAVELPLIPIDGDLFYEEPHSGEVFRFQEARETCFLRLSEFGCWTGQTTLSSSICYISFSIAPGVVTLHGWHRPAIDRIPLEPDDPAAEMFLQRRDLASMSLLVEPMKRRLKQPPRPCDWIE